MRIKESTDVAEMGWANNPENLGRLEMHLHELLDITTKFAKDFFVWEPRETKEQYGLRWAANLKDLANLTPKIDQLAKSTKRLKSMKIARDKDM